MGLKFEKAGDMNLAQCIKLLLMGKSGVGKTWAMAQAGTDPSRILLGVTEAQGLAQIRHANPEATVTHLSSWADWLEFLRILYLPHKECGGEGCDDCHGSGLRGRVAFDLVGVDGLTDLQRLAKVYIEEDSARPASSQRLREGVIAKDEWQVLGNMLERGFTALRELPYHVVATCLSNEQADDTSGFTATPSLQGRSAGLVGQFFSVVAYLQARPGEGDGDVIREAILAAPQGNITCKQHPALAPREPVNVADWICRIENLETPSNTEETD